MNMSMLQDIIVTVIVLSAAAFVCRAVYRTIKHSNDPCYGCKGCEIHRQLMEKKEKCKNKIHSDCKK